jgi:hypothetical protein
MDPMWFYDEAGELEEWRDFRQRALSLEQEHFETRLALRDAEAALRSDAANEYFQARVAELKERLADLDRRAPWISSEVPVEVLLWGVPHG